jgi:hypothetical protein
MNDGNKGRTMEQLVIHTNKYAQQCLNALTAEDRDKSFGDDRGAWYDVFEDLWSALKHGACVRCTTLGKSHVTLGLPYGGTYRELRPSRVLFSGAPVGAALDYNIMTAEPNSDSGPYVMVCYSAKSGMEIERIAL